MVLIVWCLVGQYTVDHDTPAIARSGVLQASASGMLRKTEPQPSIICGFGIWAVRRQHSDPVIVMRRGAKDPDEGYTKLAQRDGHADECTR